MRIAVWTLALLILLVGSAAPCAAQLRGADAVPDDLGLFRIARLHYAGGGDWYANPSSLPNLLEEFERRTGVPCDSREKTVTLDDERLYGYPLLYVTGHGDIRLGGADLTRLRRYLDAGGFLWLDDNYGLDASVRELVAELYPDFKLQPIGSSHSIYNSFYALEGLPKIHEHDGDAAQGFGVFDGSRMLIYYSWSSDIGDGLEDEQVHGDPSAAREAAMKMAVNICMFALTQS